MGSMTLDQSLIEGVIVQPLKVMSDERGFVKHMLRADAPHFSGFGEIYFSFTRHQVVKAWKCHHRITQHFAVPMGQLLLVIYDDRENSSTRGKINEFVIGDQHYCLVKIPPGVIYGFQSLSPEGTLVANCIDAVFDPQESSAYPLDDAQIPYQWRKEAAA
jgi:dTDP-4-dehydrorhamnose 3,5-epimerase